MSTTDQTILITTFKVREDAKNDFAILQEEMNKVVSNFPGFISLEMRPEKKIHYVEWTIVQRFRTNRELNNWRDSEQRKTLLNDAKSLLIEENPIADMEYDSSQGKENVTEVFVTQVNPENYEAYRAWAFKIQQVEAQFPGYQGIYIQAPEKGKGGNWITILRFDTPEHLDAWLSSRERKQVLKDSESIVAGLQTHRIVSPFAGWFADLTKTTGETPSIWKQSMLVLLVLFPLVMLEMKFISPLLKDLNPSLATFIGNMITVALVSWPMMPLAIFFLKWWLIPSKSINRKRNLIAGTLVVTALYLIEIAIFWHFV